MPILGMFVDVITFALLIGYVFEDIAGNIQFKGTTSKRIWTQGILIGLFAGAVVLFLSTKFHFINIY